MSAETRPALATSAGGGAPSEVKSVFCCARLLAFVTRRAGGMYTVDLSSTVRFGALKARTGAPEMQSASGPISLGPPAHPQSVRYRTLLACVTGWHEHGSVSGRTLSSNAWRVRWLRCGAPRHAGAAGLRRPRQGHRTLLQCQRGRVRRPVPHHHPRQVAARMAWWEVELARADLEYRRVGPPSMNSSRIAGPATADSSQSERGNVHGHRGMGGWKSGHGRDRAEWSFTASRPRPVQTTPRDAGQARGAPIARA
jgi:hypothetical protein